MAAKGHELPAKQARFVAEYLKDLNASAAYLRAGYKTANPHVLGPALLAKPRIKALVQNGMDKRAERVQITADDVLRNIIEIGQRCMQKWPKMVGRGDDRKQATEWVTGEDGEEVLAHVFEFDSNGALKAQELLGKHLKIFTERSEISGKDGEPIVIHLHAGPQDKV